MDELERLIAKLQRKIPAEKYKSFARGAKKILEIYACSYLGKIHQERTGEAYYFFRSQNSTNEIIKAIPELREISEIPEELEISLLNYSEIEDEKLRKLGKINDETEGSDYAFRGKMNGATNKEVVDHLGDLMTEWMDNNERSGAIEVSYNHQFGWGFIKLGNRWVNSADI